MISGYFTMIFRLYFSRNYLKKLVDYPGNIYGNISLNNGISWGLAAPRPPNGFPRVLWREGGGPKKVLFEDCFFDNFQIDL